MKSLKQKIGNLLFCVLKVVIGILLFINPIGFTSGILIAVGACLGVVGVFFVVNYFMLPIEDASKGKLLMRGLVLLLIGCFCLTGSNRIIASLPILSVIYGIIILLSGLERLQSAVDSLRMRRKKAFIDLISVAISLTFATIILFNPFTTMTVLWTFTGISLIVDAIFDVISVLFTAKDGKKRKTSTKHYGARN